jgi:endonuclease/exonuclease/phosphatase family metal-dependent hydrolase
MNSVRPSRRLLAAVSATTIVGLSGFVATAPPAAAASPSISKVTVTGATHHSLTFKITGHASRYRVYVAQVHHNLIADLLHNDPHSPWSKSKTVTVSGLKFSTTPYYFRAVAESGSHHAYSATFGPVGLKPSAPTGLSVSNPDGGLSLTWSGGTGTGYVVERAADASFSGKKKYKLVGPGQQFTPGDLSQGTSYFFRVRAVNTGTKSKPSNVVSGTRTAGSSTITAMTWNIRELDSPHPAGEAWSDRRPKIVKLIKDVRPSVIAIQEAAAWVGAVKGPREIDDLVDALGGSYKLARTEIPPTEKHYFRTANYLLYDPSVLETVGEGDHWDIGHGNVTHNHWGAYQQFRVIATGAKFVYVSFHLYTENKHPGPDDQIRQEQTESLLAQGSAYAAAHNVPIFYAGDTNSAVEDKHKFDGPRVAMQAANVADAYGVAQSRKGAKYDSANQFMRKAPTHHKHLDGIFVSPGIAATTWHQVLELSHGKFVGAIPSDHNPIVATIVVPK